MSLKVQKRKLTLWELEGLRKRLRREPATLSVAFRKTARGGFFVGALFATFPFIPSFGLWPIKYYYWAFVIVLFLLITLWVWLAELKNQKKIKQGREKTLAGKFTIVTAEVLGAVTFDGEEDLGPYWVGDLGKGNLLMLRGQELLEFPDIRHSKIEMILGPIAAIWDLKQSGSPVPVKRVRDNKINKEWELVAFHKAPYPQCVFRGKLKTWPEDLRRSKMRKII